MITAVSSFKANNFKANLWNYDAKNNAMINFVNFNQVADTFTKSNQVAFKGNLAKVGEDIIRDGAGSKLGIRARRMGEEASEVIGKGFRKLTGGNKLPEVENPIGLYDQRAANIYNYKQAAISALKKKLDAGDIDASDFKKGSNILDTYFTNAQNNTSLASDVIDKNKPTFGSLGIDVDASDFVPDAVGETAKEVGSAVASSAAGEAVAAVGTEVGTYIAEEVLGEGVCQAIERGLDCILPGVGGLITLARWGRRAYKAGKLLNKLS